MKGKEVQIDERILVYVLAVLFLIQPIVMIYKYWADMFVPIKTIVTFVFSIVIIFLLFATNLIKKINNKFILMPSAVIIIMIAFSVISVLNSPFWGIEKYRNILWMGELGREEGVFFWGLNLIFMLAGYFIFIKREYLNKIFTAMTISAVLVSLDGIVQYLFNKDFLIWMFTGFKPVTDYFSRQKRLSACFSTLGNQNYVGNFLSITLPISLLMFIYTIIKYYEEKGNKRNLICAIFYYVSVIIEFAALICTRTRGAWLGAGVGFLIFIIIFREKKYIKKFIMIIVGFLIISAAFNYMSQGQAMSRVASIVTEGKAAAQGNNRVGASRPFIWRVAAIEIKERPILGFGTNSFELLFPKDPRISMKYWGKPNVIVNKAHNEYLNMSVTMGIPATVIYLIFIISILILTLKKSKDKYISSIMCSVIGYSIAIFFSFSLTFYSVWVFFLIGVMLKNLSVISGKKKEYTENL